MNVSVIIPFHSPAEGGEDAAALLERLCRSVSAQTLVDFEAILASDGATGPVLDSAKRIAAGDSRFRLLELPKRGVSAARNAALDSAGGDWIAFADADDSADPGWLESMFARAVETGADYVTAPFWICEEGKAPRVAELRANYDFSSNSAIMEGYLPRIFGHSFDDVRAWYRGASLFAGRELGGLWRGLWRRETLENAQVRFVEGLSLYEDSVFIAEGLLAAKRMAATALPCYRYFPRKSGSMARRWRGEDFAMNRLKLLEARAAVDAKSGGRLYPFYAASCVFAPLEMAFAALKGQVPLKNALACLKTALRREDVRRALRDFPLSPRKPLLAATVLLFRCRRKPRT